MVAAGNLVGGVQAVLGEEVERVNGVEEEAHGPVDDDGRDERQPKVGAPRPQVGSGLEVVGGQRRERRVEEGRVAGHDGGGGRGEAGRGSVDHCKARWFLL